MSSLFSWLEQFLNILSTISDPWNCHIEFPNTIDVFLKRKSYLDFLIHAWKIIKSEDLVYHVFMFQFLTIIDQFSCFCPQHTISTYVKGFWRLYLSKQKFKRSNLWHRCLLKSLTLIDEDWPLIVFCWFRRQKISFVLLGMKISQNCSKLPLSAGYF